MEVKNELENLEKGKKVLGEKKEIACITVRWN